MKFQECIPCSRKPGSPILCEPCLHNRFTISRLEKQVVELEAIVNIEDKIKEEKIQGLIRSLASDVLELERIFEA